VAYAKSEKTQKRLIESTARLLRTRGYAASGLSAIVAESGVPKGSLYHHFPGGKEELAAASVNHSGDGIVSALTRMADAAGEPVRAMRDFCNHYIAQLRASEYRKGCPLATITLEAAADVDVVHEACAGAFDDIVELFTERLEGMGVGAEEAEKTAIFTVASIEGALMLAKASRDTRAIEIVRDQLTDRLNAVIEDAR
jgi:TetR/AcrR family transcriptional repressor of lmrAB and yxaGH operons